MEDKRFGHEGGASVKHWQRGGQIYSGGIHVGGFRGGSHGVTARGTAPRVRAAKSSEFGQG